MNEFSDFCASNLQKVFCWESPFFFVIDFHLQKIEIVSSWEKMDFKSKELNLWYVNEQAFKY